MKKFISSGPDYCLAIANAVNLVSVHYFEASFSW